MESLWQDLKYAFRGFRRPPGPFAVAALTMALGIGGSTAVFSVVDRILLRGLPFSHAERLVWFGMKAPIAPAEFMLESDFASFREHQRGQHGPFAGAAARLSIRCTKIEGCAPRGSILTNRAPMDDGRPQPEPPVT